MRLLKLLAVPFLFISTFIVINPAAEAQLTCPQRLIDQISEDADRDSILPSVNGDGTRVAFSSSADINGGNPDENFEIYLFDSMTGITQITDSTGDIGSIAPSINPDGTKIAFMSNTIAGMPGNPEQDFQIYLFDTLTETLTQITDTTGGSGNVVPSINSDGTMIAFVSSTDINGGNPDGNDEIYLFDRATGIFTQITDAAGGLDSISPSINADGTRIAFMSQANIDGGNPDGNFEIYLFDTTSGIFTQITSGSGGTSADPSINANGTLIAFSSRLNINGGNPDGSEEIYLFDTGTGTTRQITDDPDEESEEPSISADGTKIAFTSESNINGGNPTENEQIFLFDTESGMFAQLTFDPERESREPSISADGSRIAFQSDANINGGNPDENEEIFLAICFDPLTVRNVPTLSEWGLIAMAGVIGIVAVMFVIRRKNLMIRS